MSEQTKLPNIVLVGMAKAGKTELAKHMVDSLGYDRIRPSNVIKQELKNTHGDRLFSRTEYRDMGDTLRRRHGSLFYLKNLAPDSPPHVIDGPRHIDSFRALKLRGFLPIGVVAQPEVRFHRAIDDSTDKLGSVSLEAFLSEEAPEMNSNSEFGGQLLPILWSIPPEDIIDTSLISLDETLAQLDSIVERLAD